MYDNNIHRLDGDRGRHEAARQLATRLLPRADPRHIEAFNAALARLSPTARGVLTRVRDDIAGNVDVTLPADVRALATADQLFVRAWRGALSHADALPILEEQLTDMAGGMCPQGRVTRMLQLAVVYGE